MGKLKDKVAIVTGSSSGFGRGIALAFAEEGAKTVCSDIQPGADQKGFENDMQVPTHEAVKAAGGEAIFVKCDVTKSKEVEALVKAAVDKFGKLDIMINNAGIYRGGKFIHEFTEKDLDATISVNVKGSFFGSQEAVKQFLKQGDGGTIVNIVSTAGLGGYPKQSVYNMSKWAAGGLVESLAVEYGKNNIRVNGVCPTYCKTALTRDLFDDKDFDKVFVDSLPLRRWGEVKDVVDLALFLASDDSAYIHGTLIPVDGGERLPRYSL